ncbi:UDP-N-acetylglucosamine 4-epimerase [Breznakibacter xylanolyticus]|uniref:UDP-N-acetylglucosamine 4-epimerase n=1 Tax=Breznakibacter xylanolyticus TaxID=990 RepID=A0A2W7NUL6_9BACT|nr:SDR family oxidoreductase [Breznakibacter xylanolyticus]PZX20284.1 UDP-N-acetylglucosamine 4-epimerase [Breznakibacter xylanolyticus]
MTLLTHTNVLVTGGAGFIGSNLTERLLEQGNQVTCLDNFATGKRENIAPFLSNSNFRLIEGDIRHLDTCRQACLGQSVVLHQAALGSVPRSINDPITSNDVNVGGFVNMLVAARDNGVRRMVYAASSSTYGDSKQLPKVEDNIGRPLSPYAVTKYVNELYADVFARTYGMQLVGLRYFNVFGRRQDPDGAYAAVIPKFVKSLIAMQSPTINGDGSFSRDFTYIDNVIQANQLAAITDNPQAVNTVYNVAFGEQTSLNELIAILKQLLSRYNPAIANVAIHYGPERQGDVPHSLASIQKAQSLLGYAPQFNIQNGLSQAIDWYWHYFNQ